MVKETLIPKENKAQVEGVREIETKLETPVVEKGEISLEKMEKSDRDDTKRREEEGAKKIVGGVSAATGGIASAPLKIVGEVEKGIGEATNNPGVKAIGEIHGEGAAKPFEWVGELGKDIKKLFE